MISPSREKSSARIYMSAVAIALSASACSSTTEPSAVETSAVETSAVETSAVETSGVETSAVETDAVTDAPASTAPAIQHLPKSVTVAFDVTRNEARPLKETLVPIETPVEVLSMKVTGIGYRGMICGFSIQGEAPPSPLTIRQVVTTPAGTFDSGPLEVSWTALDNAAVTAGTTQVGSWNFSAEAHVNRSGPGWVVSIGGVTPSVGGDESEVTPTDGGCELRSVKPVFTPKVGPVGYWSGFATV